MAGEISTLTAVVVPALNDLVELLDVSDTSMAAAGSNRKSTVDQLLAMLTLSPQLRLTTEAGVPVSSADRTAQGTLLAVTCTPDGLYTGGVGFVTTYNGTRRRRQEVGDLSHALTVTSGKNYDVFLKDSDLSLVLSTAWTNDTTRADTLTQVAGLPVANADNTYLWLGTIRASGSNVIEDSLVKRYLWNAHNRIRRKLLKDLGSSSHTYNNTTVRQYNADAAAQCELVAGVAGLGTHLSVTGIVSNDAAAPQVTRIGLGENSTTTFVTGSAFDVAGPAAITIRGASAAVGVEPRLGYSAYSLNESSSATGTHTYDFGRIVGEWAC